MVQLETRTLATDPATETANVSHDEGQLLSQSNTGSHGPLIQ
jgi:hypothetical protein